MTLNLIQEQTLQALVDAVDADRHAPVATAVRPDKVLAELARLRPRKTSEAYVRRILRELVELRVDGLPIARAGLRRPARFLPTNAGRAYVEARRRARP